MRNVKQPSLTPSYRLDVASVVTVAQMQKSQVWRPTGIGHAARLVQITDHTTGQVALAGYDGRDNLTTWTDAATGALLGGRDYSAWGDMWTTNWYDASARTSFGGAGFGFSTEYQDETGLVYFGYRYYSPDLGRFLSRDPLGETASGVNLYAFAGNDPVNHRELYGLCGSEGGGAGQRGFWAGVSDWLRRVGTGISEGISQAFNGLSNLFSAPNSGGSGRGYDPSNGVGTLYTQGDAPNGTKVAGAGYDENNNKVVVYYDGNRNITTKKRDWDFIDSGGGSNSDTTLTWSDGQFDHYKTNAAGETVAVLTPFIVKAPNSLDPYATSASGSGAPQVKAPDYPVMLGGVGYPTRDAAGIAGSVGAKQHTTAAREFGVGGGSVALHTGCARHSASRAHEPL